MFLFQTYRASLLKISVFHFSDETTYEQKRTTIILVFVAAIAVAIVAILCFMLKTHSKRHIGPTNVTNNQPLI